MKLRDLYEKDFAKVPYIGIYVDNTTPIYPDYADEMLETHGDLEVVDYCFSKKDNVLVVSFEAVL